MHIHVAHAPPGCPRPAPRACDARASGTGQSPPTGCSGRRPRSAGAVRMSVHATRHFDSSNVSRHGTRRLRCRKPRRGRNAHQKVLVDLHVALVLRQKGGAVERRQAARIPLVDGLGAVSDDVVELRAPAARARVSASQARACTSCAARGWRARRGGAAQREAGRDGPGRVRKAGEERRRDAPCPAAGRSSRSGWARRRRCLASRNTGRSP